MKEQEPSNEGAAPIEAAYDFKPEILEQIKDAAATQRELPRGSDTPNMGAIIDLVNADEQQRTQHLDELEQEKRITPEFRQAVETISNNYINPANRNVLMGWLMGFSQEPLRRPKLRGR